MNSTEEIIDTICITLVVATFLLNTGRAQKAIELCKESFVFLNSEALLSIKHQFGKFINGGIYKTMFEAYRLIHDNARAITYGRKLLVIYCECGYTIQEGRLSIALAQIYKNQNNYVEAKELCGRAITIIKETGDKGVEAIAYGNLGTVYLCLSEYDKAKENLEKALAINMEIGDRAGEARNYENLGTLSLYLGEYVKAKKYFEKVLAINKEIGET